MNQSYGNRISKIDEVSWNLMQDKLKNCIIYNESYEDLLSEEITDSVLFLDPPYVEREITYNKGFNQELFLNKLKVISGSNSLILYTDTENKYSDELLNYGFKKDILRVMRNISPNRKTELTVNECLYWKQL